MTEEQKNNQYTYVYSSKGREEMEKIRRKYVPDAKTVNSEAGKLARLRQIDGHVDSIGNMCAIVIGVVGLTLLGLALCCVLVWGGGWFVVGVLVGLVGVAFMAAAAPIYSLVIRYMRKRYAPEVIALTEEENCS